MVGLDIEDDDEYGLFQPDVRVMIPMFTDRGLDIKHFTIIWNDEDTFKTKTFTREQLIELLKLNED